MTPEERRRRFASAIRKQVRARGRAADDSVVNVAATLAELQQRVREQLEAQPSDFDEYRLPELLRELDRHFLIWETRAVAGAMLDLERAWELGPQMVDASLRVVGADPGSGLLLPESFLEAMKDQVTRGLRDLTPLARERVHGALRVGVLGGKNTHQLLEEIGVQVRGPGPFKHVAFRAEVVMRTDVGRLHSIAGDLRMRQAGQVVAGLQKQWFWSGIGRETHAMANNQVRDLNEKFVVAGEYLSYPRDPDASPENTIQCGCESVPYKADWATEPLRRGR